MLFETRTDGEVIPDLLLATARVTLISINLEGKVQFSQRATRVDQMWGTCAPVMADECLGRTLSPRSEEALQAVLGAARRAPDPAAQVPQAWRHSSLKPSKLRWRIVGIFAVEATLAPSALAQVPPASSEFRDRLFTDVRLFRGVHAARVRTGIRRSVQGWFGAQPPASRKEPEVQLTSPQGERRPAAIGTWPGTQQPAPGTAADPHEVRGPAPTPSNGSPNGGLGVI